MAAHFEAVAVTHFEVVVAHLRRWVACLSWQKIVLMKEYLWLHFNKKY